MGENFDTGKAAPADPAAADRPPSGTGLAQALHEANDSWPEGEPKAWFDRLRCNMMPPHRRQ